MSSQTRSLKSYFAKAIVCSFLAPFLIFTFFFWFVIDVSNEKVTLANTQLQHSLELEILASFHTVQSAAYMIAQSVEMDSYFESTIDTEEKNKKNLIHIINTVKNLLTYTTTQWTIYNSRGHILVKNDESNKKSKNNPHIRHELGFFFDEKNNEVQFTTPLSYTLNTDKKKLETNLGFIKVTLSFQEVKRLFPQLEKLIFLPKNLDIKNFKTKVKLKNVKNINLLLFYFYILISFLFFSVAFFFSLKIFQKHIVQKILHLRARVSNEMEYKNISKTRNELASLSQTFDLYLRYTIFLQKEIKKNSQLVAAGTIAHAIAHDIRKPFSKLKFFIEELKQCEKIQDVTALLSNFIPYFLSSCEYIEHLLKEVMEAAITKINITKNLPLENILLKSFLNLNLTNEDCHIQIEYKFEHTFLLNVDEIRIVRVFVNILSNAKEAMKGKGKIWISTREVQRKDKKFLEIRIKNSNSYISKENLLHLFDPFFTLNKEKGIGLGLSIAQKIIHLHEGQISCQSHLNEGVEFLLSIPVGTELYTPQSHMLPRELIDHATKKIPLSPLAIILPQKTSLNKKCVVIVDDDPLICRNWKRQLQEADVHTFLKPEELLSHLNKNPEFLNTIFFIISDFYFEETSKYKFKEFMCLLRAQYQGVIFLSSDISLENDQLTKKYHLIKIKKNLYSYQELLDHISQNKN
jgi:signal transduction histidine kinase